MSKIEEAKTILKSLGLPVKQQNDRSALTLLALCNIREADDWKDAEPVSMSVVGNKDNAKYEGIMRFISKHYNIHYAENSRETIRRQTLHQFIQAGIVEHNPENPNLPTNSKDNHYRITNETLDVIKVFGSNSWDKNLKLFKRKVGTLEEKYSRQRKLKMIPLELPNGTELLFSPGKHNEVQVAVINEFAPRFAQGSVILYIGDTMKKDLYLDKYKLNKLGIPIDQHSKLPDIVLYDKEKNWLFLIEVATSHGPVTPKRIIELELLLKDCMAGFVFVSAFPSLGVFKKFTSQIAWETEVWIAEKELFSHLIHFNGDRFLGPR